MSFSSHLILGIYSSSRNFWDSNVLKIVNEDIDLLLKVCSMHISIFSTTLFDATRHGVKNFNWNSIKYGDYVQSVVQSGITKMIRDDENPVDQIDSKESELIDSNFFYSQFDPERFKTIIDGLAQPADRK